jgi:large subunit ribosomal protein L25
MMDAIVLKASSRTTTGKREAAHLRKTGKLPAVMYNSKGESTALSVSEAEFTKVWKNTTPSTLVNLFVDDKDAGIAFIKATEYNIISDKNLHVDFHLIEKDKPLKCRLKVQFTGSPAGVREGGKLTNHISEIAIRCLPADLPQRVVGDITNLGTGAMFRVKDLKLGQGITILTDAETPLISVSARE